MNIPFNLSGKNTHNKILIITTVFEDFITIQNLLLEIQTNSFEIKWVDGFELGVSAIAKASYDVCLVSYDLGRYNGLQLVRAAIKQGCKSPIILVTEYRDREIDIAAIKAGAADYLDKNQLDSHLLERSIRYGIERKRVEQQIKEQAALLDIATDAIFVRNLDNKIVFWNKGAETLYGWKSEEAIGKEVSQLLFTNSSDLPIDIYDRLASSGSWQGELSQINKQGNPIVVQSSWTLVRDEFSEPKSILVVNTNITQKKQLESQVLTAQRLESVGTLASGIAHDLNNLLTPMMMIVQLLQLQSADSQYLEWVSILEKNIKRGGQLVKKILSFAQGYQGEYIEYIPLPIKELILDIQQIIVQTFPKYINIEVAIAEPIWNVSGDSTQIHQILLNICLNARDAMPNGGVLRIKAENREIDAEYVRSNINSQVGSYVEIEISDTGMGISSDIIERIFDPFFTTKDREKGTGLGLSTSLGIIKSHGGFIEVNTEIRKGSSFKIYLPASTSSKVEVAVEKPPEIIGQGEIILVVDDEASVCQVTKSLLEASGYQCLVAQDGVEAVAIFAERKLEIQLVVIDAAMPLMDGLTTIRTLRKIDRNVKVVLVSALAANLEILESDRLNTQGFILKPYTGSELLQTIDRALKIDIDN
jgi:two-component system, cell cycle sensor histidine kinase and response regulator CckA